MKYFLSLVLGVIVFSFFFVRPISAQTATKSGTTNITVTVAGYQLSVSGFIAPFASISLIINNNVITSTTADAQGNFFFTGVLIPKTSSMVCFDVVDYKNIGQSQACIGIVPVNGVVSKTHIFLPPTLGVQRTNVNVGSSALAFGYGMPGATITVHISGSTGCIVVADSTGYYQCSITIDKAGTYELYADSVLNGKPSEAQLKKILIKGLAVEKIPTLAPAAGIVPSFPPLFAIPWWVWLLLVLLAIIPIIILLKKYWPQRIPVVSVPGAPHPVRLDHLFDFLFRTRKLHHWWMKGVGF